MKPEELSVEKVRRFYLMRHHLLHKAQRKDFAKVVKDVCGLQAQMPLTPYLSLWNRVENFENDLLDEALYKNKTLVKVWSMRGTLHIISSEDLPIYSKALKRMWFEGHKREIQEPDLPSTDERKNRVYPEILEALAQKPLTRKELEAKLKGEFKPYPGFFSAWGGILKVMAYEGLVVHAQPCNRESCFARLDKWLPHINLDEVDEDEAKERLLIKYLHGYGPASTQDFSFWSGLMAGDFKNIIDEKAGSLLEMVEIEGLKGRLWMLKEDLKAFDSMSLDEKMPPSLLPKFDSFVLGHKDRTRIIRSEHIERVVRWPVGDVAATLLINGQVIGTWKHAKTKQTLTVTITPFKKLNKEDLKEVEAKAKELSQFMGVDKLQFKASSSA